MHVLLVEDEARILRFLSGALNAEGHTTQCCSTYDEAEETLQTLTSDSIQAVILDRMLGGKDGTNLIALIRKQIANCAIIVLSALNSPEEKACVLDLGADDYVAKPFSLVELSARVRALGRRTQSLGGRVLKLKDCHIDLLKHEFVVHGHRTDLTAKEYQLLSLFCQSPGRVFSRFQLLDRVWNLQHDVESNVVEVAINGLRKKLREVSSGLEISSKRNVGYWLEA